MPVGPLAAEARRRRCRARRAASRRRRRRWAASRAAASRPGPPGRQVVGPKVTLGRPRGRRLGPARLVGCPCCHGQRGPSASAPWRLGRSPSRRRGLACGTRARRRGRRPRAAPVVALRRAPGSARFSAGFSAVAGRRASRVGRASASRHERRRTSRSVATRARPGVSSRAASVPRIGKPTSRSLRRRDVELLDGAACDHLEELVGLDLEVELGCHGVGHGLLDAHRDDDVRAGRSRRSR